MYPKNEDSGQLLKQAQFQSIFQKVAKFHFFSEGELRYRG